MAPKTITAAERVFGIAELLELILADVDGETLLTSQRVCSAFNDIIKQSRTLRQKLCMRCRETWDPAPHKILELSTDDFPIDRLRNDLDLVVLETLSTFHIVCRHPRTTFWQERVERMEGSWRHMKVVSHVWAGQRWSVGTEAGRGLDVRTKGRMWFDQEEAPTFQQVLDGLAALEAA